MHQDAAALLHELDLSRSRTGNFKRIDCKHHATAPSAKLSTEGCTCEGSACQDGMGMTEWKLTCLVLGGVPHVAIRGVAGHFKVADQTKQSRCSPSAHGKAATILGGKKKRTHGACSHLSRAGSPLLSSFWSLCIWARRANCATNTAQTATEPRQHPDTQAAALLLEVSSAEIIK